MKNPQVHHFSNRYSSRQNFFLAPSHPPQHTCTPTKHTLVIGTGACNMEERWKRGIRQQLQIIFSNLGSQVQAECWGLENFSVTIEIKKFATKSEHKQLKCCLLSTLYYHLSTLKFASQYLLVVVTGKKYPLFTMQSSNLAFL